MKTNKPFLEHTRIKVSEHTKTLDHIQGHILKSHAGSVQAHLFLEFKEHANDVKKLIQAIPVTSASQQFENYKKRKKSIASGKALVNGENNFIGFYMSIKGYHYLSCKDIPDSPAFRQGMEFRDLNDPTPEKWEDHFHKEIHALIVISSDTEDDLNAVVSKFKEDWKEAIVIHQVQFGHKLKNDFGRTIEHFGYVDGISQPLFYDEDFYQPDGTPVNEENWNPEAPLSLVLNSEPGTDSYGSYLVFRKLEQNVKGFKTSEHQLANELGLTGEAEEMAGAMMIGRFENGLPIIKTGSIPDWESDDLSNDFDYDVDPSGSRCPFHAHIRKSNPRGDNRRFFAIPDDEERSHRIVRRGITYDEVGRNGNMDIQPEKGVGLLFLCFQNSIENQFEFIQRNWVNNNDFPIPFTGIDPVIGQGKNRKDGQGEWAEQKWNNIHNQKYPTSMADFVTMKGGGYFYAPSLKFLRAL